MFPLDFQIGDDVHSVVLHGTGVQLFSLAFIYRQLGTCRCVRMSSQSSYNYPVRRCQDIDIKVCIHLCGRENHHIQLIAKKAITMAKKRASGEGNIRKRKDSRWEGRYTAGYDSKTGKRIIRNVLGNTQAGVKEKLKAALEEVKGIDVTRSEDYTVATWLRTWYELYAKPNVRTATANRYELIIGHYTIPRIGSVKLKKLTTRHLQKLYKELLEDGRIHVGKNQDKGLSTTTVRSVHLMLHCALDRAVKERLIPRNPSEDCIVPRPRKLDMKILPPEHIHAYLKAAQARGLLPMLSRIGQRSAKGGAGGPAMGRRGHPEQDDFSEQTVRSQPRWFSGADPAQDGKLGAAGVYPPGCGGAAAPGA